MSHRATNVTANQAKVPGVREMIEGHQVLPRDFRLAPTDVRRTAHEDRRQARRVAAHPRYMIGVLHHHHAGDRLLRPKHFQKVPVQLATTLGVVEAQHEAISALLEEVDPLLQRGLPTPGQATANTSPTR